MPDLKDQLKKLPQVDEVLRSTQGHPARESLPRGLLAQAAREVIEEIRQGVLEGRVTDVPSLEDLSNRVLARAVTRLSPVQCRVINATGVVLHTNLGRAVLSRKVLEDVLGRVRGYSLLEKDRDSGLRTKRDLLVSDLITEITGAEAATVVNNNAAATHLILHTLAAGKEVICSHAHLVGIGGSFRLPDCMRQAGVTLRTVGATNHCLLSDYEKGINENTGMLLSVHTSNYQIVGFTKYASLEDLVALGHKHEIPVVYDLGSGALIDVSRYGYKGHRVRDSVALGPDLICFSGDKLLGGPQAGIIVGRSGAVEAIRKSPYYRMMRPDKVTLALLESTLRLYMDPETVDTEVPVLRMIRQTADDLRPRARRLASRLRKTGLEAEIDVFEGFSEIGGGSLSNQKMPTVCVGIRPTRLPVDEAARRLRKGEPCIIVRVSDDRLVVEVRTLLDGEDTEMVEPFKEALQA